ncbi:MAG: hypothetical protein ABI876_10615 [Bacteroidota bacterium]
MADIAMEQSSNGGDIRRIGFDMLEIEGFERFPPTTENSGAARNYLTDWRGRSLRSSHQ